jgi:hypothetical protein
MGRGPDAGCPSGRGRWGARGAGRRTAPPCAPAQPAYARARARTHTRTRTRARAHTRSRRRTRTRTHAHAHAHARTHNHAHTHAPAQPTHQGRPSRGQPHLHGRPSLGQPHLHGRAAASRSLTAPAAAGLDMSWGESPGRRSALSDRPLGRAGPGRPGGSGGGLCRGDGGVRACVAG